MNDADPFLTRRRLIRNTTFAAAGMALASPAPAAATGPARRLRLGLIGCGARGRWISALFQQHGGYEITAAADYFKDRLDTYASKFRIPAKHLYSGLSGYRKLVESAPVDAVAIESPPYFHPEQTRAAVEAGKHVYLAKPIAVDVAGCLSIKESGALATRNGLCLMVDFQTRADEHFREAIHRVHDGAIGEFSFGESSYHAGVPFPQARDLLRKDPGNPEYRLRAWGVDRVLSGDIITEQNIHALDVACWLIDQNPIGAVGTCGRKARKGAGTCNDHFGVLFNFPDEVLIAFASKQYGIGYNDIGCRMFGPQGTVDTHYFGDVKILGRKPYRGGKVVGLYTNGAAQNVATFHDCIREGKFDNPTVPQSVRSNLTTILGRTAAYRREPVTWDEMIKTKEKLEADLSGLKA